MKMDDFLNKKILITGATGFVGSHLTEELINRGAKVVATTHHPIPKHSYFKTRGLDKKCKVVKIELSDFKSVRGLLTDNQPRYIFHLAAQPIVDIAYSHPWQTFGTNITGTINILENARLAPGIKGIIFASSDKAYGKLLSKRKYKESDPLAGDHPYEVSKSAAELIAHTYFKTYGTPIVSTRFGNIYGEGDLHFSRLIPGLMKAMVKKEVLEIRSNGRFVRDYLYVKDVVRGYLLLAGNVEKTAGEAYNFGSDDTYDVIGLIRLIGQMSHIPVKYKILNTARNEIPYQSLDWTKIKKLLGWKPETNLKSTIGKIFDWYCGHLS